MKPMETIIEEYAAADEERRLSMFLTHKDLRQQFTAIDMAQWPAEKKVVSKRAKGLEGDHRSQGFPFTCWGWLKQCCSVR